jgi:hypothetical protein
MRIQVHLKRPSRVGLHKKNQNKPGAPTVGELCVYTYIAAVRRATDSQSFYVHIYGVVTMVSAKLSQGSVMTCLERTLML